MGRKNGPYRNARWVEELFAIRIRHLMNSDCLNPGASTIWNTDNPYSAGPDQIGWIMRDGFGEVYRIRDGIPLGDPQRVEFLRLRVGRFTGHQTYFACPGCNRRSKIIYIFEDEPPALCRLCHGPALHATTRMNPHERAAYRAELLRNHVVQRHHGAPGAAAVEALGFPPRPAGMRRHFYDRLAAKHAALMARASPR